MWSCKLHTYASELKRNEGGVEADEVGWKRSVEGGFPGGGQRGDKRNEEERGREGSHTMTSCTFPGVPLYIRDMATELSA